MKAIYSEELRQIINKMIPCAQSHGIKELNSVILVAAFMSTEDFSSTVESCSNLSKEQIDTILELAIQKSSFYSEEDLEKIEKAVRSSQQLDEDYEYLPQTPDLSAVFEYAKLIAEEDYRDKLDTEDIVISLIANQSVNVRNFFNAIEVDVEELMENYLALTESDLPNNLADFVTILNQKFEENSNCAILGRDKECNEIWKTMLKKTKRNVILTGPAGVGKSSIVYKLTCDIINGNCPKEFQDYIVLSLNVNSLISGTTFRGQAEERYKYLIEFLESHSNVILFIDEIHMIVGAGSSSLERNQDFSNALKPILAGDDVIVIGATTEEEYNSSFGIDGALKRRFRKISVKEPKTTQVYAMLKDSIKQLEEYHGVKISKKMVDFIIFNSSCFNYETKNPDRTKDLIDLSMVTAKVDGKDHVDKISVMKNFNANFELFHNMSAEQIKATAYHEIGHYLMWRFSGRLTDEDIVAISIIPAENYLGVNVFDWTDNIPNPNFNFFIDSIAESLAGRIAEKKYTQELSSGASSDLQRATRLAYDMVAKYGMCSNFGTNRVFFDSPEYKMHSEKTTDSINTEIKKIIDTACKRAESVLTEHEELLNKLVEIITKKGMMNKLELEHVVQNHLQSAAKQ